MNSSLVLVVAALFLICSPLLTNGREQDQNSLVNQICMEKTFPNKDDCIALVKVADPKIAHAKTYPELAEAVLALGQSKSKEVQAFLNGLWKLDNSLAFYVCSNQSYHWAESSFTNALIELKRDLDTASFEVSTATDGLDECDQRLLDANISIPEITAFHRKVSLLSQIATNAIDKIPG